MNTEHIDNLLATYSLAPDSGIVMQVIDRTMYIEGTETLYDWVVHNFNLNAVSTALGVFHEGYYGLSLATFDTFRAWEDVDLICGHSLGGAMAIILSRMTDIPFLTYATPNFVWEFYGRDPEGVNYYHVNDIVGYVPPFYSKRGIQNVNLGWAWRPHHLESFKKSLQC